MSRFPDLSGAYPVPLTNPRTMTEIAEALNLSGKQGPLRLKTWDLAPMFHCSIIGTCLTAGELRKILAKSGDADAKGASDHAIHSRGVHAAGRREVAGKLLNKALDKRHERIVKQFSAFKTSDAIRRGWNEAVEDGDISGAYWAVMSHSVSDRKLLNDVFGEVHMLSHRVGSSSRLDLARLNRLQRAVEDKDNKLERQERRLAVSAARQAALHGRIAELEERLVRAEAFFRSDSQTTGLTNGIERTMIQKLDAERDRSAELASRLEAAQVREAQAVGALDRTERRAAELEEENRLLEGLLFSTDGKTTQAEGQPPATLLYVGGRRNLFERLRTLAEERGIALLLHDGGLEDNTTLLPTMIGQAEVVFFPVDHISHTAAGVLKRICRESGKRYRPLRSAGLASFIAAVSDESVR